MLLSVRSNLSTRTRGRLQRTGPGPARALLSRLRLGLSRAPFARPESASSRGVPVAPNGSRTSGSSYVRAARAPPDGPTRPPSPSVDAAAELSAQSCESAAESGHSARADTRFQCHPDLFRHKSYKFAHISSSSLRRNLFQVLPSCSHPSPLE